MPCTEYKISFFNGGLTAKNPWIKKTTSDQKAIGDYIAKRPEDYTGKTCLHIGTGTSSIAISHHKLFKHIDGLTICPDEFKFANDLQIPNYTCYLINKHKLEELNVLGEYDVIIDNNIKTYACCDDHYNDYFNWILASVASRNGEIITHTQGYYDLDNREIDSIASRVQYKTYEKPTGKFNMSIVLIKPINPI